MRPSSMAIQDLRKDCQYRVQRDFAYYYYSQFTKDESLSSVELHFLLYHGSYTLIFKERTLLQENANSDIPGSLADYLLLATE